MCQECPKWEEYKPGYERAVWCDNNDTQDTEQWPDSWLTATERKAL